MRFIKALSLFLLLLIIVSGCAPSPTEPTAEVPAPTTPAVSTGTGYPGPGEGTYPQPGAVAAQEEPSGEVTALATDTPDPVRSPLIIASVSRVGEMEKIVIRNISAETQDLTKYALFNPDTQQKKYFEAGVQLAPGDEYAIYNGPLPEGVEEAQKWADVPMLNQRYDEIVLLNQAGRLLWDYVYYP